MAASGAEALEERPPMEEVRRSAKEARRERVPWEGGTCGGSESAIGDGGGENHAPVGVGTSRQMPLRRGAS